MRTKDISKLDPNVKIALDDIMNMLNVCLNTAHRTKALSPEAVKSITMGLINAKNEVAIVTDYLPKNY